jgi:hypothetical protein
VLIAEDEVRDRDGLRPEALVHPEGLEDRQSGIAAQTQTVALRAALQALIALVQLDLDLGSHAPQRGREGETPNARANHRGLHRLRSSRPAPQQPLRTVVSSPAESLAEEA